VMSRLLLALCCARFYSLPVANGDPHFVAQYGMRRPHSHAGWGRCKRPIAVRKELEVVRSVRSWLCVLGLKTAKNEAIILSGLLILGRTKSTPAALLCCALLCLRALCPALLKPSPRASHTHRHTPAQHLVGLSSHQKYCSSMYVSLPLLHHTACRPMLREHENKKTRISLGLLTESLWST
jgi:hypothetical protein